MQNSVQEYDSLRPGTFTANLEENLKRCRWDGAPFDLLVGVEACDSRRASRRQPDVKEAEP
jgi:hypothetical protein